MVAGLLGVKNPGDPRHPQGPRQVRAVSHQGLQNSSAKRSDGEQMTARYKGLMKVVSRFPRATTSATEASTVHTSHHEQESRTKSTSRSQFLLHLENSSNTSKSTEEAVAEHVIHCRTKRCEETYQTAPEKTRRFSAQFAHADWELLELSLQFTRTPTTIPLHTTGMCGTLALN